MLLYFKQDSYKSFMIILGCSHEDNCIPRTCRFTSQSPETLTNSSTLFFFIFLLINLLKYCITFIFFNFEDII